MPMIMSLNLSLTCRTNYIVPISFWTHEKILCRSLMESTKKRIQKGHSEWPHLFTGPHQISLKLKFLKFSTLIELPLEWNLVRTHKKMKPFIWIALDVFINSTIGLWNLLDRLKACFRNRYWTFQSKMI